MLPLMRVVPPPPVRLSPALSVAAVPLTVSSSGPPTKVSAPVVSVNVAIGLFPRASLSKVVLRRCCHYQSVLPHCTHAGQTCGRDHSLTASQASGSFSNRTFLP